MTTSYFIGSKWENNEWQNPKAWKTKKGRKESAEGK